VFWLFVCVKRALDLNTHRLIRRQTHTDDVDLFQTLDTFISIKWTAMKYVS